MESQLPCQRRHRRTIVRGLQQRAAAGIEPGLAVIPFLKSRGSLAIFADFLMHTAELIHRFKTIDGRDLRHVRRD